MSSTLHRSPIAQARLRRQRCDVSHRAGRRLGLHDPDRRPRGGRHLRLGPRPRWSSSRPRPAGDRAGLHLRRHGHGARWSATCSPRSSSAATRWTSRRAWSAMVAGDPQPRPARHRLDGDLGGRRGAVGPEGAGCSACRWSRSSARAATRSRSTAAAASPRTPIEQLQSSSAAGSPRASRASR